MFCFFVNYCTAYSALTFEFLFFIIFFFTFEFLNVGLSENSLN